VAAPVLSGTATMAGRTAGGAAAGVLAVAFSPVLPALCLLA
jgi:hypothetical protein